MAKYNEAKGLWHVQNQGTARIEAVIIATFQSPQIVNELHLRGFYQ